jgi:tRNA pseudouridine synthase 10
MEVLDKAFELISKHPLCDYCLGRQFAQLGYSMENNVRGHALKVSLTMQASELSKTNELEGVKKLKLLATNGFCKEAKDTITHLKKRLPKQEDTKCYLCEGKFELINNLVQKGLEQTKDYDFTTFLVGIEIPVKVQEREDELKAALNLSYGESLRHEFGRVLGKAFAAQTGKEPEYLIPDLVYVVNPFTEQVKLQNNPLFVAGRYRKLARTVSQSIWFCSSCRGKGCQKCGGTGKMYPESVEEFTSKPLLKAAMGEKSFFHASGREDIDALMLGTGRPFIVEISKPKKRFLDLVQMRKEINEGAVGKVEVSKLKFSNREVVRRLKKGEGAQKQYDLLAEFEKDLTDKDLHTIEEKLSGVMIKQQTPRRVVHRRADLVRERYIYKINVKKVSLKTALLEIHCQGGLYVKELVSGDEGRTQPNVSDLLGNKAKTLKLDVVNVIVED